MSVAPASLDAAMWRELEGLALDDWFALELPCEMKPPELNNGHGCERPAVWRVLRWCGCVELSCEECRAGYMGWMEQAIAYLRSGVLRATCRYCGASVAAQSVSDVIRRIDAL